SETGLSALILFFQSSQTRLQVGPSALVAPSFNGRTADSGSAYRGSNPWGAAKSQAVFMQVPRSWVAMGRGGVPLSINNGLVAWWKLDDAASGSTPTTAADSSGN